MNTDNNFDFDEDLIPVNPRSLEKETIFTNIMNAISCRIQSHVTKLYASNHTHPACRRTFIFLRKNQIDHVFEKSTYRNEFVYSLIFLFVKNIYTIKCFFDKSPLTEQDLKYLNNDLEINEGFVYGVFHMKSEHIKH